MAKSSLNTLKLKLKVAINLTTIVLFAVELQVTTFSYYIHHTPDFFIFIIQYMTRVLSFLFTLPSLLFCLSISVSPLTFYDSVACIHISWSISLHPSSYLQNPPNPFLLSHFLFVAHPKPSLSLSNLHPCFIYLSVSFPAPRGTDSMKDLAGDRTDCLWGFARPSTKTVTRKHAYMHVTNWNMAVDTANVLKVLLEKCYTKKKTPKWIVCFSIILCIHRKCRIPANSVYFTWQIYKESALWMCHYNNNSQIMATSVQLERVKDKPKWTKLSRFLPSGQ